MAKDSEITVISVGPGAEDMITLRALRAIDDQDVIIAGRETAVTFASEKNVHIPDKLLSGTIDFINSCEYRKIGVLATGDAGFFSIAKSIRKNFNNVRVIAGVSSVAYAFSLLPDDWSGYRFLSVHGRELTEGKITEPSVILCDGENTPDRLLEKHPYLAEIFDILIFKDVSLPSEKIFIEPQRAYDSTRLILVLKEKSK